MAVTTEIAPNIYPISIFAAAGNLQFNHFLVKDNELLLFHAGLRGMHAEIREAVSKLINLSELRHISFSHFESDECGLLRHLCREIPLSLRRTPHLPHGGDAGVLFEETERTLLCSDLFHQIDDVEPLTSLPTSWAARVRR